MAWGTSDGDYCDRFVWKALTTHPAGAVYNDYTAFSTLLNPGLTYEFTI